MSSQIRGCTSGAKFNSSNVQDALTKRIGTEMLFPVYSNTRAQGSAHLVVDDVECYRTLDNEVIPWGAKGANTRGFHIEIAGFAEWNHGEWMKHDEALRRAAYKAAVHAKKFGIPIRWLTGAQLKAGEKGFVTHAMCTTAFGGTHIDPGRQCPTDQLLDWAKAFADEL